jgi:hypothetical protein
MRFARLRPTTVTTAPTTATEALGRTGGVRLDGRCPGRGIAHPGQRDWRGSERRPGSAPVSCGDKRAATPVPNRARQPDGDPRPPLECPHTAPPEPTGGVRPDPPISPPGRPSQPGGSASLSNLDGFLSQDSQTQEVPGASAFPGRVGKEQEKGLSKVVFHSLTK